MKRTYEKTHEWLNFVLETQKFPATLWVALGEASSKCEHIRGTPLSPEIAERFRTLYLAKGALATAAIEGNTLSEDEVRSYLDGKLTLPPSREYLGREIDNIVRACNDLTQEIAQDGPRPFSVERISKMNAQILYGLELDEGVVPGEIRKHSVTVGRYRCAPPEDCKFLLDKFCDVLNKIALPKNKDSEVISAIIKAVFAHLYFVGVHPFGDGNGRTARLIELYILLSAGLPHPVCHLLSNHYNRTRSDYYRKLDGAVRSVDDKIGFYQYAIQGFVDGLREYISEIKKHQQKVAWEHYVHEIFHHGTGPTDVRRRHLILAISKTEHFVPKALLPSLTPDLALLYQGKQSKTLTRDLNELETMKLIERRHTEVRARTEIILAFLPWANPKPA
ncbi:MAG: hypothetical protein A2516_01410 [Alphaproteobacteria bacterium RIFOXYD12_FULL_60_8]|nr:MAG: hypothetical protein A2516_01410 [Alphaproteobacteria bacterium RIFOXYD12_FULL_60_8]